MSLAAAAKAIEDYEPLSSDPYLLDNQIELLLVLAGAKRATEWHLYSLAVASRADMVVPVDERDGEQLEGLLRSLGVQFSALQPRMLDQSSNDKPGYVQRITYRIAATSDDLQRMERVWTDTSDYPADAILHGILSGFPPTAIEAFKRGPAAMLPRHEVPRALATTDGFAFARFALSRAHWQDELRVGKQWADIVKRWSPKLYQARIDENAQWLADYGYDHVSTN